MKVTIIEDNATDAFCGYLKKNPVESITSKEEFDVIRKESEGGCGVYLHPITGGMTQMCYVKKYEEAKFK